MSKTLTLKRFHSDDKVTLGKIICGELIDLIFTCELPWLNNKQFDSCIPKGKYKLIPWISPNKRIGKCLKILDVPGRTNILIHKGNSSRAFTDYKGRGWKKNTEGCILPGMSCRGDGIVQNSMDAFNILVEMIDCEWNIEIV